jgi:predicted urease superfamily metal-dependent hydrolase
MQILALTGCGEEEITNSQLLYEGRAHIGSKVQFDFELGSEQSEVEVVVCVGTYPCEFVELVEVDEEPVAYHFVDGLVVAQRTVLAGDDTRIGPQ